MSCPGCIIAIVIGKFNTGHFKMPDFNSGKSRCGSCRTIIYIFSIMTSFNTIIFLIFFTCRAVITIPKSRYFTVPVIGYRKCTGKIFGSNSYSIVMSFYEIKIFGRYVIIVKFIADIYLIQYGNNTRIIKKENQIFIRGIGNVNHFQTIYDIRTCTGTAKRRYPLDKNMTVV